MINASKLGDVRVCVNTFNRLKKIREGIVYDSITTVIDELLQNCQRTFAVDEVDKPTIDIIVDEKAIIIRDNGSGCSNPQSVFEFEASGWNIEDAFGQGGSESVFQIADIITIRSQYWKASVDVEKMLSTGDLTVVVSEEMEYFSGYEISLIGLKITENHSLLLKHIKKACSYLPCDCYVNGDLIERRELQEINSPFSKKFDNEFYSANLGVQTSYKDSAVYYEKRKVCDIWLTGVYGIIELKRGAVNLKVPDRKSIIYDSKYYAFRAQITADCKSLYSEFVKVADYNLFKDYESGIDQNLEPADYADYLPDYQKELKQELARQEMSREVPSEETISALEDCTAVNRKNVISGSSSGRTVPGSITLSKQVIKKGEFKQSLGKLFNTVWCEAGNRTELQELINRAEECGLRVLYSKGRLYNKAFAYWGIPHINDVLKKTEARYIIGSVSGSGERYYRGLSKKEDRLMRVLQAIEKHYGLEDVFKIAEVKEHLLAEHDGQTVVDAIVNKTSAPVKDRNKIYLDRASLNLGKVNVASSSASITKFDILIVLLNIQTIASGLAQIIYDTVDKTVEHYSKMEKISKEIALLLASF